MRSALPYLAGSVELALAFVGAVLLWRLVLSPAARARGAPAQLLPWNIILSDFLTFLLLVVGFSFASAIAAGVLVKFLPLRGDAVTVFNGGAAQLGMLLGVLGHRLLLERLPWPKLRPSGSVVTSGAATFLISLPILIVTAKTWEFVLELAGLPTDKQDLVGMFARADSAGMLAAMIVLAVVVAPLTEELVFRAGLFRHFRTRMPTWAARLLPALFFASLHVNWNTLQGLSSLAPLVVLAVIFSIAYERTGRIGTSIVAHALFNLNTVLLIFSGVGV